MLEEVKKIIAEVLEVAPSDLSEETAIGDISTWDSLRQIMIVAALEERFNIQFDPIEIMDMEDVGDIAAAIEEYKKA